MKDFLQTPIAPPALAEDLLGSCEAAEAAARIGLSCPPGPGGTFKKPPPVTVQSQEEPPAEGSPPQARSFI